MALNQPGDQELIRDIREQLRVVGVVAVLYKHPTNITGLQFMAEASGLRTIVGGVTYRVLAGTAGMHVENSKLPGVQIMTKELAFSAPLVVKDFAGHLTNGDPEALFSQLAQIQAKIQPAYGLPS